MKSDNNTDNSATRPALSCAFFRSFLMARRSRPDHIQPQLSMHICQDSKALFESHLKILKAYLNILKEIIQCLKIELNERTTSSLGQWHGGWAVACTVFFLAASRTSVEWRVLSVIASAK